MKPKIKKLGTIDCDLVETTPIVFKEKLYRFEYIRTEPFRYWGNKTDSSYFRFIEHDTGVISSPFAWGYHLGNAFVEDEVIYVTGTNQWDGDCVDVFASKDMTSWDKWNALKLPGYGIYNTSICRADTEYVLMFEVSRPFEVAGVPFTARFATSKDMKQWILTPPECNYAKDRYTAPHCLRFLGGYFYNFYLESCGDTYEQFVVRSDDLIHWEQSPHNPVLRASDQDRKIANPNLSATQRQRIATAANINNSDIDFCEYKGRLIINYSWGNQQGIEHLAEAIYEGTLTQFLIGWYNQGG